MSVSMLRCTCGVRGHPADVDSVHHTGPGSPGSPGLSARQACPMSHLAELLLNVLLQERHT